MKQSPLGSTFTVCSLMPSCSAMSRLDKPSSSSLSSCFWRLESFSLPGAFSPNSLSGDTNARKACDKWVAPAAFSRYRSAPASSAKSS